jgi:rubredoxin
MKCSLCGYEFEEDKALVTCRACLLFTSCNMVCCPNCGYEMPIPKEIKFFKKRRSDKK